MCSHHLQNFIWSSQWSSHSTIENISEQRGLEACSRIQVPGIQTRQMKSKACCLFIAQARLLPVLSAHCPFTVRGVGSTLKKSAICHIVLQDYNHVYIWCMAYFEALPSHPRKHLSWHANDSRGKSYSVFLFNAVC